MKTFTNMSRERNARSPIWKWWAGLSGVIAGSLLMTQAPCYAAVPAADVTLQPVASYNLPVITSATGYDDNEADSSGPNIQAPLYGPYDSNDDKWWDQLVAELLQSRMPVVMMENRGAVSLDPNDMSGNGNMNPRRLAKFMAAINRAGAANLFQISHLVDTPAFTGTTNLFHNNPNFNQPADLSVEGDWDEIWWKRAIKIFHDTIPSSYWHRINGRPVIYFWSLNSPSFSNQNGNGSRLLRFLENKFIATYGEDPVFVLNTSWFEVDPSVATVPAVIGSWPWFDPYTPTLHSNTTYKGFTTGTMIPGYINPAWFDPTSPQYHASNAKISRSGGNTLKDGLDAALANNAQVSVVEGWTNTGESAGIYRSLHSDWATPNQYIEMIRSYSDLRTVTLKLEAEGCDSYQDTTTGNSSGTVFRRSGDLDIRALSGSGWAVTNTAANEWIQFTDFKFSAGNYKFPVRYSSTASHTMRLYIDGVALPAVVAPSTGGANNFDTIYLGSKALTSGKHTLRLVFVDGGVDVDWLFVKKYDSLMSLKSQLTGYYVAAENGGGSILMANRTSEGLWERFSVNDLNGAGAIANGDTINLQCYNGLYAAAVYGGGNNVELNRREPSVWEAFTVVRVTGSGPLASGDKVAFKSYNGTNYLTAKSDGTVDATGTSIGMGQTFTVNFTAQ